MRNIPRGFRSYVSNLSCSDVGDLSSVATTSSEASERLLWNRSTFDSALRRPWRSESRVACA